ncbi:MAG: hypothetical protein ACD_81C00216G0002 [uncultured bacterium]|uniref:Metallophosphoesterase ykuE n=1 Tax=Candidatus Wolfebacteria bacterium GW2011_GWE2_44_13 TaxID=1619017 RepID=A0A0G1K7F6_9BACT|nr:MAG: hypothetical protein ACD_81C00216G0002 [uncultured bacterium]KKT43794.1 MAG: Metallophosphoesterase ykuE [Candidatus Wolfebacteria bacterium GW2011_GWE2_44_13]
MEVVLYFFGGLAGVLLGLFLYTQNKEIGVSDYTIGFEILPDAFNGFRIVQLSDLHNKRFGKKQRYLIDSVRSAKPDIIVITGDIIGDGIFYDAEPALELACGLRDIAPVYYVTGNHEWDSKQFATLGKRLVECGVHMLDNRVETLPRKSEMMAIAGIDDAARYRSEFENDAPLDSLRNHTERGAEEMRRVIRRELDIVQSEMEKGVFTILLAHRPEFLNTYARYGVNLVFSGHAHGGQWNMPNVGPLVAPGQGLFPKLVAGVHRQGKTTMVISRGIGNSGIAFQRLFNKPEVVVVALRREIKK